MQMSIPRQQVLTSNIGIHATYTHAHDRPHRSAPGAAVAETHQNNTNRHTYFTQLQQHTHTHIQKSALHLCCLRIHFGYTDPCNRVISVTCKHTHKEAPQQSTSPPPHAPPSHTLTHARTHTHTQTHTHTYTQIPLVRRPPRIDVHANAYLRSVQGMCAL